MIRSLHRWPGLVAALLLSATALSGTALSLFPAAEALNTPATAGMTVAQLAATVQAAHPGTTEISRSASGRITAFFPVNGKATSALIDPTTGAAVAQAPSSPVQSWLIEFHRSLFLNDGGRMGVAAGAGLMLLLSGSGLALLARRNGGWGRLFTSMRGTGSARWHAEVSRLAATGLIISSATALWMTAATFDLLPQGQTMVPPTSVSHQTGFDVAQMPLLQKTDVSALRDLKFPRVTQTSASFSLKTSDGQGYIDQGTGQTLAWAPATRWDKTSATIEMLHTGEGAPLLGLALGLSALAVPMLGLTGARKWAAGRSANPRSSSAPEEADFVILVGSEGGSTWGFAETLQRELSRHGLKVHTTSLSDFAPNNWRRARHVAILAATYGDGDAPSSARGFIEELGRLPAAPQSSVSILGFGDKSYPAYCAYAEQVAAAVAAKGWKQDLPLASVDRQSPQDFAQWGQQLARLLALPLTLEHVPHVPATAQLTLVSRRDYGESVQAPTSILRFAVPHELEDFQAGDLLAIVPQGSTMPRHYSIASARRDGFLEICVKKQPGGLCSGQIMNLLPGQGVAAFIKPNPNFHARGGKAPLLLIGAGTGIGPLAGFARANARQRPMHLFFGTRHAQSDFLYEEEFAQWLEQGRLSTLTTAFSRGSKPHHVQDALRQEARQVARLIANGAYVMVCGGRAMAKGVKDALTDILANSGLSPAQLKLEGRYAEDVY